MFFNNRFLQREKCLHHKEFFFAGSTEKGACSFSLSVRCRFLFDFPLTSEQQSTKIESKLSCWFFVALFS